MIDQPETVQALASPFTDEELIKRVGQGDHRAFELLIRRHQDLALNVAYGFIGDAREAQDLVQEAFLRVYRYADGELDPATRERIADHIRDCEACAAEHADASAFETLLAERRQLSMPPELLSQNNGLPGEAQESSGGRQ